MRWASSRIGNRVESRARLELPCPLGCSLAWLRGLIAGSIHTGDRFAAPGAKPGSIATSSANYWRIRTGAPLAEIRRPCRDTNCIDEVSNLFANRSVSRGTNFGPDPSYGAGRGGEASRFARSDLGAFAALLPGTVSRRHRCNASN